MRSGVRKVTGKDTGETSHPEDSPMRHHYLLWHCASKVSYYLNLPMCFFSAKAQVFPHFHFKIDGNFFNDCSDDAKRISQKVRMSYNTVLWFLHQWKVLGCFHKKRSLHQIYFIAAKLPRLCSSHKCNVKLSLPCLRKTIPITECSRTECCSKCYTSINSHVILITVLQN